MARGGLRGGGRSSGCSSGSYGRVGGLRSSGHGRSRGSGHSNGKSYPSSTKSFVSGKIAGQYRAKGYSKSHAQRIGNSVMRKMGSTFKAGRGSKRSYAAGAVTGYYQGQYGLARSTRIGNAVTYGKTSHRKKTGDSRALLNSMDGEASVGRCDSNSPGQIACKYDKSYGKSYLKNYSKKYK